ncbi:GAF domain-containing protein [Psychromarinibacter sp. C21-152]|uniref:GAF domain-containing protein n=1 Tax=Psychromarinibacter sediminicola TaxID=3033385 RepID=A0AAE3NUU9_9RHOB|nr:GAF domain-containing protein [Psychromarinibacter sediminicola]MDF0602532.1 GAF domain-containing protein [Psychromarinibacter sediminicola]
MDVAIDTPAKTFIEVTEVWVPDGDRLVLAEGDYGALGAFEAASRRESFARGEGLPGKAWAEARPVVLKGFDGSYFKRTEAATAAGLTAAVAIPVFAGSVLKAVLVTLCGDDDSRTGAIEVWREQDGLLMLDDGYYGAAKHFEWVSQHTHFPRGQGLPGGVWAAKTPILMRDLGSGYRFIRADSAAKAGLTTGLGLPVPVPGGKTYVLTLLSAKGTPIARRFELWDARAARNGTANEARLIDGICAREGALWDPDNAGNERTVAAWQGAIGRVLGTGVPLVQGGKPGLAAGYDSMVALPIHQGGELAHIVAWYL